MHNNCLKKGTRTRIFKVGVGLNGDGTPVEVFYEKGIKKDLLNVKGLVLGLGGNLGYYGYKENFPGFTGTGSYSWKYTNMVVAGLALGHYSLIDKLDTYGMFVFGYNIASTKFDEPGSSTIASPSDGGLVLGR